MKKVLFLVAVSAAATVAAVSSASAQTTVYSGFDANTSSSPAAQANPNSTAASAQFQGSLSGVNTESFEHFNPGTSAPLTLAFTGSSGTINAVLTGSGDVASATRSNPTGSGQFATDGNNYYEADSSSFAINFSGPVAAFGFYATDIESDLQVTLAHVMGANETFSFNTLFGTSASTPSGSVNFLGLIDTANPFTSVTFSPGSDSSGDIFAFDQMTIGDARQVVTPSVPEAATWAMMIAGFGMVGVAMRRRQPVRVSYVA